MKSAKVKIPAKINLSLKILGSENGYHKLESVVASINIYNTYFAKKSRCDRVIFSNGISDKDSNAYKALCGFNKEFNTQNTQVKIKSKISVGAGLGSSSADVAGTLKVLEKLYYNGNCDKDKLEKIANELGSDCSYMLNGGLALLGGRGEKIKKIDSKLKLFLIVMLCDKKVSTKDCYEKFDKMCKVTKPKDYVKLLEKEKFIEFIDSLENDLYIPAKSMVSEIENNVNALNVYGKTLMTGSGSAVYTIFNSKKERDRAYRLIKKTTLCKIIKAKTI